MMGLPTGWKPQLRDASAAGLQPSVQQPSAAGLAPTNAVRRAPMPTAASGLAGMPRPTQNLPAAQPSAGASSQNAADAERAYYAYQEMKSKLAAFGFDGTDPGNKYQNDFYANSQNLKGQYSNTPFAYSQNTNWHRPGGDPNAPWASGQDQPMAGVDQRVAGEILNPGAYQYGGRQGMADSEVARYGGLAEAGRYAMAQGDRQYQEALGQYGQGIGMSDQARGNQTQALQMLQGLAQGTGPSAAQAQMARGMAQAREQQASIAANARGGGGNLAAAQAAGAQQAANISLQGLQEAGALRSQEQMAAIGAYGDQAGALRNADYARSQMSLQQQSLAAQQQQFGAGQASQYEQYLQAVRSQQQGYQQAQEQQNLAREAAQRGWSLDQQKIDNAETNSWLNAGIGAGSALLMAAAPAAAPAVAAGGAALAQAAKKK